MALSAEDERSEQLLLPLRSGELADFTIRLDSYEFKVHGVMLSRVSKFFRKACVGQFQEASNRIIELHDDDPRMLGRLILFCYVGRYPDLIGDTFLQAELERLLALTATEDTDVELTIHAAMYGMGDKYDMPTLKAASIARYISTLKDDWYSPDDFIKSIQVAFSTTPDSDQDLRKWIVWEAQQYAPILSHETAFRNALKSIPEFACDMVTKYVKSVLVVCESCKKENHGLMNSKCVCGMSGMCQRSEYCDNPQKLVDFCTQKKCYSCKEQGLMVSASSLPLPKDDDRKALLESSHGRG